MRQLHLSSEARQVLACLPPAPGAAVVREIAQDVFQLAEASPYAHQRVACGKVRLALKEIGQHFRLYRDYRTYDDHGRPIPWGQRERYGIVRENWPVAREAADPAPAFPAVAGGGK